MKIDNILLEMNNGLSVNVGKGMHQIPKLSLKIAFFFSFFRHPIFFLFLGQKFIIALAKVSKQERREE